jgi:endogenous inhibitor of DNA gyrase (YacG/DUF329 family)
MSSTHICKYCGKQFDTGRKLGGHVVSCKMNPNSQKYTKAKGATKTNNVQYKDYEIICPICGKHFILNISKHAYENHQYTKTCSRSCAAVLTARNTNIKEKNANISNGLSKFYNPIKRKRYCAECGKEINTELRNTSKFCCEDCKNIHRHNAISNAVKGKTGGYRVMSGNKHHKSGKYDNIYFDSSWELAFYVYHKDHNLYIERCKEIRTYIFENKQFKYYPDFITDNGIIEIKGYITKRTEAKHEQNKDIIVLYHNDIEPYLKYMIKKYGNNFWEVFYE